MNIQAKTIDYIVANKAIKSKLSRYDALSHQLALLQRKKEALKAELLNDTNGAEHIKDEEGHELAGWQYTLRNILDTKRLKLENQSIYDRYLRPSSVTTLTIYYKK
jgi:predicted phage-related endonuclease